MLRSPLTIPQVANLIVNQFFPQFLASSGFYAFYMFAGINFLLAAFVYFFVPETKKVKLEEIDTLFGGSNHVEKGANILNIGSRETSVAGQGGAHHPDTIGEVREAGYHNENKTGVSQVENVTRY